MSRSRSPHSTSHETIKSSGEEEQFEVDRILSHKVESRKKRRVFLVHWKGYDNQGDDTWEPESNLHSAQQLLTQYLRNNDLPVKFNFEEHKKLSANKTDRKVSSVASIRKPTKRSASTDEGEDDQMERLENSDVDEGLTSRARETRGKKVKTSVIQSQNKRGKQKDQLAKSVDNREQILKGLTPGWLSDSDDDKNDINKGEEDNEIGEDENADNQNEGNPQDQLDEAISEHQDMLKHGDIEILDNLHNFDVPINGNPSTKQKTTKEISNEITTGQKGRKGKKTGKPGNSSTAPHNDDAVINGLRRPTRVYGRRKTDKTNSVFGIANGIQDVDQKYTFMEMYRSPHDNEIHFQVRKNDDLEEVDMMFNDALDTDARGVAKFLAGLVSISSGYTVIKSL